VATFIRPARVDITEGSNGLGQLIALAMAVAAAVAVVAFILAHLVFIAIGLAATAAVVLVSVRVLYRHATVIDWAPRPQRAAVTAVTAEAIPAPQHAAIEAPQYHLHFHGVSAEDIATIMRQAPARPAIKEQSWSSPSSF
jgi:hypothetical protein